MRGVDKFIGREARLLYDSGPLLDNIDVDWQIPTPLPAYVDEQTVLFENLKLHLAAQAGRLATQVIELATASPSPIGQDNVIWRMLHLGKKPYDRLAFDNSDHFELACAKILDMEANQATIYRASRLHSAVKSLEAMINGRPSLRRESFVDAFVNGARLGAWNAVHHLKNLSDGIDEVPTDEQWATLSQSYRPIAQDATLGPTQLFLTTQVMDGHAGDSVPPVIYQPDMGRLDYQKRLVDSRMTDQLKFAYRTAVGSDTGAETIAKVSNGEAVAGCPMLLGKDNVPKLWQWTTKQAITRGMLDVATARAA